MNSDSFRLCNAGNLHAGRANERITMRKDAIVEEVRRSRDERAAKFAYDIHAIAEDARQRERQGGRKVVSFVHRKEKTACKE
jgi:hypothetical protein